MLIKPDADESVSFWESRVLVPTHRRLSDEGVVSHTGRQIKGFPALEKPLLRLLQGTEDADPGRASCMCIWRSPSSVGLWRRTHLLGWEGRQRKAGFRRWFGVGSAGRPPPSSVALGTLLFQV